MMGAERGKRGMGGRAETCKCVWMGKGVRERHAVWGQKDEEAAFCAMVGCSGVECWWHVVGECVGKGMRGVREQVYGEFLRKLHGLKKDGVSETSPPPTAW